MKKYQSYKPSGVEWIGEIPESWNTTKLKYFLDEIITGGTPDTSNDEYWIDNGINWISISDITSSPDGILETKKTISEEGRKSKNLKVLEPNSLIYSIYGSIGKVNRIKVPSTIHQGILSFITNKKLNNYYLEKYLIFLQPFISSFSSSNTQDNLNQDKIKNLYIQIPPLQEQEQIVKFLDEKTSIIDKLISTKERKIELLKEQRTSLINQVITKGLNPNVKMKDSGVEWIGEIPESWRFIPLKYFVEKNSESIRTGPFGSSLKSSDITDSGVRVYNQRMVYDESFDKSDVFISEEKFKTMSSFIVLNGDVLISSRGTIGKMTIVPDGSEIGILHPCLIRIRLDEMSVFKKFLWWYMNKSSLFLESVKIESNSTTIDVIYSNVLSEIKFPIPPLVEQKEIVEYLEKYIKEIDDLVSLEQKKIELLKEYRQSLISEVITGKIKVVE